MPYSPRVLCFAGSLRRGSVNKKLVKIAMQGAQEGGAQVTYMDLSDYPLPLYDGDLEEAQGLPENARKLKALLKQHDAFILACPEYNSSITAVLKNVIDWASRPEPGEEMLACFRGKVAALMSASPGALGGLRGLVPVRSILENIGTMVLPDQATVPSAQDAFNEDGSLKDDKKQKQVMKVGRRLADVAQRLAEVEAPRSAV
jgi:chromate reductase, NAD(P)H dehydrogenase (quinone)